MTARTGFPIRDGSDFSSIDADDIGQAVVRQCLMEASRPLSASIDTPNEDPRRQLFHVMAGYVEPLSFEEASLAIPEIFFRRLGITQARKKGV